MPSVLLLDDNHDFRHVLTELLETLGCEVHAFESGQAALDHLAAPESRVEIIVCDIHMPDMDGFTFLRHVRQNPAHAHICIIAASGARDDRAQAMAEGANAYILKPFNVRDLVDLLQKCQQIAPAADSTAEQSSAVPVSPEEATRDANSVRVENNPASGDQAEKDD